ncbi:MAG: hypothetical protein R3B53_01375 [Candidatus Paceibacterota bacterium]
MQNQALKKQIMRRVYYSYALSVLVSKATLRGFILGFSGFLFMHLVSLSSIVMNLLSVQVKAVPEYVWGTITGAVATGEFMTLISLGVIVFSLLSFGLPKRPIIVEGNFTQRA